jgi:serine protease inhibitor
MSQRCFAFRVALLGAVALGPCPWRPLLAQDVGLTLTGTVRDEATGMPVRAIVAAGGRSTVSDSTGHFVLRALPRGSMRVTLRGVGFARRDTTVILEAGGPARLDVSLQSGWEAEARAEAAAQAADAAAGRVDSSALGFLGTRAMDAASPLTFGSFGGRLLAAAVHEGDPDSNTVISPVSAGLALSLALLGARGNTQADLARTLGMAGLNRASLVRDGAEFLAAARGRTDVQLEIASAIWVDSVARLTHEFAASAAAWRATAGTQRLVSSSALERINHWADSVTHGKISHLLGEPLPDSTVLFLANAVYFKGRWLEPFDKSATRPRDFTLASGRRISVHAMEQTGWLAYRREPGYQVVRLSYRGGRTAMYVILPDSGAAPGTLEKRFATGGWPASLVERDKRTVHLVLPKLHVQQSIDLRPLIATLGAGRALDCKQADFRDLAAPRVSGMPPLDALCIDKAAQAVYLDVDEEGTEAAAVTGLGLSVITSMPPPPPQFIVDRPFLFVLRDERSGADLFVGSIRHP